jgi:hypothetical protein
MGGIVSMARVLAMERADEGFLSGAPSNNGRVTLAYLH